jgi:hypothetical protein
MAGETPIGFHPDGDNGDATFGRWTDHFPNKLPGIASHNAMQIDPPRDIIVVSVHALDELHALDPADPAREIARLRSVGQKPLLRPYAALEYAPSIDRIVYFSPMDDGIVYTIARRPSQLPAAAASRNGAGGRIHLRPNPEAYRRRGRWFAFRG